MILSCWPARKLNRLINVAAQECGMRINVGKTEVMKVCEDPTPVRVTVNGVSLREVNSLQVSWGNVQLGCPV